MLYVYETKVPVGFVYNRTGTPKSRYDYFISIYIPDQYLYSGDIY